jgi:hypothetical protein
VAGSRGGLLIGDLSREQLRQASAQSCHSIQRPRSWPLVEQIATTALPVVKGRQ